MSLPTIPTVAETQLAKAADTKDLPPALLFVHLNYFESGFMPESGHQAAFHSNQDFQCIILFFTKMLFIMLGAS